MNRDASFPEPDPAIEALVDSLVEQLTALEHAAHRADLSGASMPELRQLLGLVSAADEALDRLLVVVDSAKSAS